MVDGFVWFLWFLWFFAEICAATKRANEKKKNESQTKLKTNEHAYKHIDAS